jgi:ATP:ADP antiporter, AAA family
VTRPQKYAVWGAGSFHAGVTLGWPAEPCSMARLPFIDVRRGEWPSLTKAFATLLLLIMAHATLETARDALVLTRLPSRALGIIYVAVAVCVLPAVGLASRMTARSGPRRALGAGIMTAATLVVMLFVLPMNRVTAVAVYVASGLISAVLVPLYWNLLASVFNAAQARRVLGIVSAAGLLGAVMGSTAAAALLAVLHTRALLLVSAALLLLSSLVLVSMPAVGDPKPLPSGMTPPTRRSGPDVHHEPFVRRIALLVIMSTTASVFLDYFFKWTVARAVPHSEIASFVARYYAWLNGLSLVSEVFVTGALVRHIGVARTMLVTPMLLLLGAVGTLMGAGALMAVMVLKAIDGTLRSSVHRVTMEIVYLPVPTPVRAETKFFIDSALARVTQAAAGIVLLALGAASWVSSWLLAAIVIVAAAAWLAVAVTTRGPYIGLLRRTVMGDPVGRGDLDPIDLESAETLVEHLADQDPLVVLGALNVLARRGGGRLIPALILLHEDRRVLERALDIFGASTREDWVARARQLLTGQITGRGVSEPPESIRMAAARALATHAKLNPNDLALEVDPRLHAYAVLHLSLASDEFDPLDDPSIATLLDQPGPDGEEARLGLLAVIVDVRRTGKVSRLLTALETRAGSSREWTEGLAKAAQSQGATTLIPQLISRVALPETREAVRSALVSFGRPAMDEVWATLLDPQRHRRLRAHLPLTLARFGTRPAAELLLRCVETEKDGLIRYRAIRGLGRMIAAKQATVDRTRVERLAYSTLIEHFRLLALRAPYAASSVDHAMNSPATLRLLVGLLDDKLRQSLERVFRLLKIAHPLDDIHRVQIAIQSKDIVVRANAGEFLDALLRRGDQRPLRELILLIADDLSVAERVRRGSALLHMPLPETSDAALALMVDDADAVLSALASLHAATVSGKRASVAIGGGLGDRPAVELSTSGPLVGPADARERPSLA